MFGLGPTELILILVVVLVIFGPSKLPQIGRSFGRGIREFRSAAQELEGATKEPEDEEKKSKEGDDKEDKDK